MDTTCMAAVRRSDRARARIVAHIAVVAGLVAATFAISPRATSLAAARCDFDNDGFEDLAIGVPGENVGHVANAGAVNVIYGTNTGLNAAGDQIWHQDRPGIAGAAGDGDAFGATVVCGNFNVDQYDDLAIGVPGEDIGAIADAGAVHVLYGSAAGLSSAGSELWHQDVASIEGAAEAGDRFGAALASGDFNDDFADDLAVGVPGEDLGALRNAGAVSVLYGGGGGGLTAAGNQLWTQDSASVRDTADDDESFGFALATGDFDNDGYDDLAIGVPGEDLTVGSGPTATNAADAGAVNLLNGSPAGLAADRDQFWSQSSLQGAHESGDHFGHALTSGDFDDDGFDDLAVGVPGEDLDPDSSAGAVNVIYGSNSLLTATGNQVWHQDVAGVAGATEEADAFGAAVVAGDFDGDGDDDLAIGVPGEDVGGLPNAGAVNVLFGTAAGLASAGNQLWHQNSASIEGVADPGNVFGSFLAAGDFDGDAVSDLVVGVPGEGVNGVTSAGAANVLYGTAAGLSGAGDQIWHQGVAGIEGALEPYDRMGSQPLTSRGVYRVPYADGTLVSVTGDHFSHSPDFNEYDMHAEPNDDGEQYTVVAAAAGTIMAIDDSNAEPTNSNNYVWIAHSNGEWSKYTHLQTGSVAALGLSVGDFVSAGAALGIESNVGQASGIHLHFEVAFVDDLANPIDSGGFVIGQAYVPLICNVAGNVLFDGQSYTANPC